MSQTLVTDSEKNTSIQKLQHNLKLQYQSNKNSLICMYIYM